MKTWIASWKPYFSLYRLKAMQETQYRAAALGGLVTQAFFGLLYVFLYTALFRGENQAELAETITYVWLQQMFFRDIADERHGADTAGDDGLGWRMRCFARSISIASRSCGTWRSGM